VADMAGPGVIAKGHHQMGNAGPGIGDCALIRGVLVMALEKNPPARCDAR
jgi:hypothetical protein